MRSESHMTGDILIQETIQLVVVEVTVAATAAASL